MNKLTYHMKEMGQDDYVYILDEMILNFININNVEPKHIIMNPTTYEYLKTQLGINGGFYDVSVSMKYRGYSIFRSYDVSEGDFKLG